MHESFHAFRLTVMLSVVFQMLDIQMANEKAPIINIIIILHVLKGQKLHSHNETTEDEQPVTALNFDCKQGL